MAKYSAVKATVNAYIKQNGRKEITGRILNAVLNATIDSLGKYFQFAGGALPTDDPGTPDQNLTYLAGTAGTYTNFGGLTLDTQEIALLMWDGEWKKQTLLFGIQEVDASVDNQVGTPSVDVDFENNVLTLSFHNIKGDKGDTGDPAGFGQVTASVDDTIGNPSVQVQTSGEDTAKNIAFEFHGLRGETGITSVVVSVDNTAGNPACSVSLVGQVLHLDFTGLKGLKGDTGVSADYPITIYNGLDSDATDQALAAAQGKVLDGKISQLGQKVDELDGQINGQSFEESVSFNLVTGQNIETTSAVHSMPLVAGKVYKVTYSNNRPNGTSVSVYLRTEEDGAVQFKYSDNPDDIASKTPLNNASVGSTILERYISPVSNSDRVKIYAPASNVKDTIEFGITFLGVTEEAGLVNQIRDLEEETESNFTAVGQRIDNSESDISYTKKVAGGQSSIKVSLVSGTTVEPESKTTLFIPAGSSVKLGVDSNSVFSDGTPVLTYLWYDDGTRSSAISTPSGGVTSAIQVSKNVVAVGFYIHPAPASGDITLRVLFQESMLNEVNERIDAIREVIPLRSIWPNSTTVQDWAIGDMYFGVENNNIRVCISTSPLDFLSIPAKKTIYSLDGELYLFDGVSITRYYNNTVFDGDVLIDYPVYVVGENVNNDNTGGDKGQYIYKDIVTFPISADEGIMVSCSNIAGATAGTKIAVDGINNGQRTRLFGMSGPGSKIFYPSTDYESIVVRLYPATSGLQQEYARYDNVRVTKGKVGNINIKKELLPDPIVPAYYLKADYLKNKIEAVRSLISASGGDYDAFVFCTDIHWPNNAKNSPAIIRYICRKLNIPRLMLGGDYADGINLDCNDAFNETIVGRIYRASGNHEYMNYFEEDGVFSQRAISDAEVWQYLNAATMDAVSGNPEECYFFVDNAIQKMRYIFLSVFTDGSVGKFSNEQEAWFRDVALNLPAGYTAVVISHMFVAVSYPSFVKEFTPIGTRVANIVDAYNGSGEIACLLHGHTHIDLQTTTPGGVPVFATTCDKFRADSDETSETAAYIYGKRHEGTITEQAFDVVVIDKKNKLVTLVRIGAPADVDGVTFAETRTANY